MPEPSSGESGGQKESKAQDSEDPGSRSCGNEQHCSAICIPPLFGVYREVFE